jgi:3-hydroxyacyl-CoA dehydrogenase
MTDYTPVRVEERIAYVAIDNPPVNGLSHNVRAALFDAFRRIRGDTGIDGVVLHGAGRCFSAGGDIREFGTPAASADPGLSKDVHPATVAEADATPRKPIAPATMDTTRNTKAQ